jgi:hypothetical protein
MESSGVAEESNSEGTKSLQQPGTQHNTQQQQEERTSGLVHRFGITHLGQKLRRSETNLCAIFLQKNRTSKVRDPPAEEHKEGSVINQMTKMTKKRFVIKR